MAIPLQIPKGNAVTPTSKSEFGNSYTTRIWWQHACLNTFEPRISIPFVSATGLFEPVGYMPVQGMLLLENISRFAHASMWTWVLRKAKLAGKTWKECCMACCVLRNACRSMVWCVIMDTRRPSCNDGSRRGSAMDFVGLRTKELCRTNYAKRSTLVIDIPAIPQRSTGQSIRQQQCHWIHHDNGTDMASII